MSLDVKNMTLTEKAEAAFRQAEIAVIERARQTGTPVIVWENGQVRKYSAEEMMARVKRPQRKDENPGDAKE